MGLGEVWVDMAVDLYAAGVSISKWYVLICLKMTEVKEEHQYLS